MWFRALTHKRRGSAGRGGAMRTVIFDLDGTLADTSGDLIAAANAALGEMGRPPALVPGRDAAVAVCGARALLALGLERLEGGADPAEVDAGYPVLLEAYGAAIDVHTRLYPGAEAALDALAAAGYGLGICTNKPVELAELLMRRLGLREAFGVLIGAGSLPVRKPDPAPLLAALAPLGGEPARCVLVGDTDTDRETARAAGALSCLVAFGPAGEAVRALEPEAVIDHFDALPDTVRALIG